MTNRWLSQLLTLWNTFSLVRYGGVNVPLGAMNFSVAFGLMYFGNVNHHIAISVGHFLHVAIGFFLERRVTFRALDTAVLPGMTLFAVGEATTYAVIVMVTYLTIDVWSLNPYLARIALVTPLSTLVAFLFNKHITFQAVNQTAK